MHSTELIEIDSRYDAMMMMMENFQIAHTHRVENRHYFNRHRHKKKKIKFHFQTQHEIARRQSVETQMR